MKTQTKPRKHIIGKAKISDDENIVLIDITNYTKAVVIENKKTHLIFTESAAKKFFQKLLQDMNADMNAGLNNKKKSKK